jgi:hypothetical protein
MSLQKKKKKAIHYFIHNTSNQQNALQRLWYILLTEFSPTCVGSYCGLLQGDVTITGI